MKFVCARAAVDGRLQQPARFGALAAVERRHAALQQLFRLALALGEGAPRPIDVGARPRVAPIEKQRSCPDVDRALVPSGEVVVEAGEQTTREGCKRFEDGEKAATEKIKSQGMKVINFGTEDKKVFDTAFKAVAEDWVKDINKRGKPGTEVFKAFTEALAAGH